MIEKGRNKFSKTFRSLTLRVLLFLASALILSSTFVSFCFAISKQSPITLGTTQDQLVVSITPATSGAFAKSSNATISAKTDNFTGYKLTISSDTDTSLTDGSGYYIQ